MKWTKIVKVIVATVIFALAAFLPWLLGRVGLFLRTPAGAWVVPALALAFIGFPVGLYWANGRRRWLFAAVLNFWLILSYRVGGWLGFAFAFGATSFTFIISACCLRELYDDNEYWAVRDHLRLVLGLLAGYHIVDNGKLAASDRADSPLGPRRVIVRPYNAVIMEQGSRQTRISGPAVFVSAFAESVRRVYDLREKQERFALQRVLSSELMPTTVTIWMTYHVNVLPEAARGQSEFRERDKRIIQQLDSRLPNVAAGTRSVIEECVRRVAAGLSFQELLAAGSTQALAGTIRQQANAALVERGVLVDQVIVESVQPEQEVTQASTSSWVSAKAIVVESDKALAWISTIKSLAAVYSAAIGAGVPPDLLQVEAWRNTLDQVAKDINVTLIPSGTPYLPPPPTRV